MSAILTADMFCSLDGFGSVSGGGWGGYWDKQGPDLLAHRLALYSQKQRLVLGAKTHREFVNMRSSTDPGSDVFDPWVNSMVSLPTTVVSSTLKGPLDWPDATLEAGDGVDVVARLKKESDVPLRTHGSLSLNRSLLAAGLVDRLQVTVFPALTGQSGTEPLFHRARDFDLELLEARTLDGRTQELVYRPSLR